MRRISIDPGYIVLSMICLGSLAYANSKHLFDDIEIQKYYAIDESKDFHLYYDHDKLLTVDAVSSDFQFVAEGSELGDDNHWRDVTFDNYYRIITKDGINYLVDAADYSNICLYGFEELGKPFYLKSYDKAFGGLDTKGDAKYSGYVLPYKDKQGNLCLVDLDSFEPLLMGVTLSEDRYATSECFADQSHIPLRNYLENRLNYFQFYDASYGGIDEPGEYSGYVVYFNKGEHTYLVDLNDFSKVLVSDFKDAVFTINASESVGLEYVNSDGQNVQCLGYKIPIEKTDVLRK